LSQTDTPNIAVADDTIYKTRAEPIITAIGALGERYDAKPKERLSQLQLQLEIAT
jgi:hypothetical protein